MSGAGATIAILAILLLAALSATALLWRRLRVLEAQRRTEAKLATAFRSSPDAIMLATLPEGRYLEVNRGFTRLTGWSREEALGRTNLELGLWAAPEDRQRLYETIVERGGVTDLETRFRRRDGEVRWCLAFAEILEIEGRRLLFSVIRDVTAQKLAAEALRTSEEKFATAFHASPDAVLLTAIPDGTILDVNEGWTRITGWSRDEAVGRSTLEIEIWGDLAERERLYEELSTSGRVRSMQMTARRKDGMRRQCELSAEPIILEGRPTLLSVVRDVTELRRAEAARRASEDKFAAAFRSIPDAIAVAAVPEGRILEINDSFTRMLGYRRGETIGRTALELGMWVDAEERKAMFRHLEAEGEVRDFEVMVRHRSGRVLPCVASAVLLEVEGQATLISVTRDVSELRRAEAEREAMIKELEAKNTELERFTYTVSHDLKSPLVTIRGFLGLLERHAVSGDLERFREDAKHIRNASDHMRQLLDELLELSRVGRRAGPYEEVALGELARTAADRLTGELEERGVEVEIAADLPVVVADRLRLMEVFQNILTNAVKFLGDEAAPRIEIGRRDVPSADGAEETVIFVRDNGIGIEPRYHERIFGLFDRLDPQIPGTGVGLALVKRIVEAHGGRIWVESGGAGQGSTFCFTLGAVKGA